MAPIALLGIYALTTKRGTTTEESPLPLRTIFPLVFGGFLVLVLTATFVTAWGDSRALQDGRPTVGLLGLVPMPWSAEVSTVAWKETKQQGDKSALPACVFFLGEANGTTVLFKFRRRQPASAIRVPSADVVIRHLPDTGRCSGARFTIPPR